MKHLVRSHFNLWTLAAGVALLFSLTPGARATDHN
jgi:hypothetical protein